MLNMMHEMIEQLSERIIQLENPEMIVLLDEPEGDSPRDAEVTLLAVVSEPFDKKRTRWEAAKRLRESLANFPLRATVILYSKDQIEKLSKYPNHLVSQALQEGTILHRKKAAA